MWLLAWLQDLKSPNVLLKADGSAKIGDVGLSRILSNTHVSAHSVSAGRGPAVGLRTHEATVLPALPTPDACAWALLLQLGFSWAWVAPEVLLATRATAASDIFAFGVIL